MTRALQHTATDLLGTHPNCILHTLQAEVLLAYYLFRTGRFVEAKSHTAAAVALAIGSGFHRIRSSSLFAASAIGLSSDTPISLHPPKDSIEEGERINGFWTVFMLHKYITVALESPSSVCGALEAPGTQLDTPWPLDISSYVEVRPLRLYLDNTVYKHLARDRCLLMSGEVQRLGIFLEIPYKELMAATQ